MKHKLGRFIIQRRVIRDAINGKHDTAAGLSALFGKCIVIDATYSFDTDVTEYVAYCEDFDEIPEGTQAPRYEVAFRSHEDFIAGQRIVAFDAEFKKAA